MPSSGIAIEKIKNITDNTLNNYVRDAVEDLYLDLTKYVGYMLCESGQFDEIMSNGVKKQWQVLVDGLEHDTHVGPYSQITLSDNTISAYAQLAMRHTITHFLMDYLEQDANSSPAALVSLVKLKTQAMMEGHVKSDENWIWSCPAEGDDKTPLGFPAWAVMYDSTDATPESGGFLGTYPYGGGAEWTTSPDGLDLSTNSLAGNWAAKYSSISFDDLVDKMITAADKTNFQAPTRLDAACQGHARGQVHPRGLCAAYGEARHGAVVEIPRERQQERRRGVRGGQWQVHGPADHLRPETGLRDRRSSLPVEPQGAEVPQESEASGSAGRHHGSEHRAADHARPPLPLVAHHDLLPAEIAGGPFDHQQARHVGPG
jgi:hypothetical protein